MTVRLKFLEEWRTYRADESYNVPKPLANILVSRGFAVVSPVRKTRSRRKKQSNGDDKDA